MKVKKHKKKWTLKDEEIYRKLILYTEIGDIAQMKKILELYPAQTDIFKNLDEPPISMLAPYKTRQQGFFLEAVELLLKNGADPNGSCVVREHREPMTTWSCFMYCANMLPTNPDADKAFALFAKYGADIDRVFDGGVTTLGRILENLNYYLEHHDIKNFLSGLQKYTENVKLCLEYNFDIRLPMEDFFQVKKTNDQRIIDVLNIIFISQQEKILEEIRDADGDAISKNNVIENVQWVADYLASNYPEEVLISSINQKNHIF